MGLRRDLRKDTRVSREIGQRKSCFNCGKPGHIARDCWTREKRTQGERHSRCFICGKKGHWARYCSQRETKREKRSQYGAGQAYREFKLTSTFSTPRLGGNPRGRNGGKMVQRGKTVIRGFGTKDLKDNFVHMIPEIRTVTLGDIPHVVVLMVNGVWCRCLVDTGAAVSLIQKRLTRKEERDPHEQTEAPLMGITGHRLNTDGTILVPVGTEKSGYQVKSTMIVCSDELLGEVGVLFF